MTESEKAEKVIKALRMAECEPAQMALPILNELVGLLQRDREQPLEIEEARSSAFLAICEVGKALHRGKPTGGLWASAIAATERWMSLVR
jgi:hypothetical protein